MVKRMLGKWSVVSVAVVLCIALLGMAALAQQPTRIQVGLRGEAHEWWDLIDDFHAKHPHIIVEHIQQVDWNMDQVILQEIAGDPYDVVYTVIEQGWALVEQGILLPLDEFMEKDTSREWLEFVDDVHFALWDMWKKDGKQYFIPYEWNNMVMYYNTKLFDESGLHYPEPGWTWDEFLSNAQALQRWDGDNRVVDGVSCHIHNPFGMGPWVYTTGATILNEDWTESTLDDPRVVEAFDFVRSLIVDYEVSEIHCPRIPETGFVGQWGAGRWVLYWYDLNEFYDYDIVTWPIHPTHGQQGTSLGGGAHGISANSRNKEAAWEFIKWLNSPEIIDYWTRKGDSNPSRASVAMTDAVLRGLPSNAMLYYEALDHSTPVPSPAPYMEIDAAFHEFLFPLWDGLISAQEAVSQMHERISTALRIHQERQ